MHRGEVGVRQSMLVVHRAPLHVTTSVEAFVVLWRKGMFNFCSSLMFFVQCVFSFVYCVTVLLLFS